MKLTKEQLDIIYSEYEETYVNAKAGTGKTTTLSEFVKYRKRDNFLYLVYNNAMKDAALNKFPKNTEIHTVHSLALKHTPAYIKEKITNELKTIDLFNNHPGFKGKDHHDKEEFDKAYKVISLLKAYFNLSVKTIDEIYYPDEEINNLAKTYWDMMLTDREIKITHDGYLKLYQLSNPVLDYDYIMVDEAQDSNEVMLDIVYSQKSKKIFVGDVDQKIYGFRGALNVFENNKFFDKEKDHGFFYLTESFRFGPVIAEKVNLFLEKVKENPIFVKGIDKEGVVGIVDKDYQYTLITRTNAHLFDLAYEAVLNNKKINIIGDTFIFREIKDVYNMYIGNVDDVNSDYIKSFHTFRNLKTTAKNARINDLNLVVKIVETYDKNTLNVIHMLEKAITGKKKADIIFSTAHKSKGLEFLDVVLANDFLPIFDEDGHLYPKEKLDSEEMNLYYVALTRAMNSMELNRDLKRLI